MSDVTIQDVFERFLPEYAESKNFSDRQYLAVKCIQACRTAEMGAHVSECDSCHTKYIHYNSCKNRHCPMCQGMEVDEWIDIQQENVLNTTYFHTVFTVPEELYPLIYSNQKLLYDALYHAANKTLTELSSDKKYLGAKIGYICVLHTWGSRMNYHPHLHTIVLGGGLDEKNHWQDKNGKLFFPVGSEKTWSCRAVEKAMKSSVDEVLDTDCEISCKEITVWSFTEGLKHAENNRCLSENSHYITNQNAIDYFENRQYKVKQKIYEADGFDFESAIHEAECLLCDSTMVEEIERIYSEDNPKVFKGHPVHYRISCSENDAAFGVVGLLIKALVENKRLFGCRADVITEIQEGCYDEVDLDNVIMVASGNAVIIDTKGMRGQMHGNFATAYEEVVRFFDALIRKYSNDVLFIFLEDTEYPGFSKSLLSTVQEYMNLIEIKEGRGDTEKARKYIEYIVKNSEISDYAESAMEQIVLEEPEYTVSELHKIYNKWRSKCLSKCVYKSYAHYEAEPIGVKRKESDQKLEDLVGLDKVKVIANQIMATHVIDKRRMSATAKRHEISKHMIFTGNPGTAKTTVARILARMLKDEEVLETGKFIECGRADLVAKYVGWTAREVQKKFRMADGGILFIDEAYALVDDAGSFGDEAINSIVQEMENYRDRVIVIFAGYPDKMKTFLEKNEGLRSRIAFYVDFPDYKADELMQILDVMLEQREYRMTDAARKRTFEIIVDGMRQPDFGNGRFVRNVLEQAIMRQSVRLYNEYKGKTDIPREALLSLEEEDFEVTETLQHGGICRKIGFSA